MYNVTVFITLYKFLLMDNAITSYTADFGCML